MINRIELSNFKSFKHLNYRCSKLNLLTGLNGSGKSSLITALLLMRSLAKKAQQPPQTFEDLRDLGFDGVFSDLKYCYGKEPVRVLADFTCQVQRPRFNLEAMEAPNGGTFERIIDSEDGDEHYVDIVDPELRTSQNAFNNSAQAFAKAIGLSENELYELPEEGPRKVNFQTEISAQDKQFGDDCMRIQKREESTGYAFYELWRCAKFVSAMRIKPHVIHEGGHFTRIFRHDLDVQFNPEGSDLAEFLCKFGRGFHMREWNPMRFPTKGENESRDSTLEEQLAKWLDVISPGSRIHVKEVKLGDETRYLMSVGFEGERPKFTFKPQNVGFGISYVLPILVTLLTAHPGDTVIMENPEAHLHPRGQAEMGALIARAAAYGVQIFVETHSDHVINGVRVAVKKGVIKPDDVNIAFFTRKAHETFGETNAPISEIYSEEQDIKINADGELSDYPSDFMDEWTNQLLELV